MIWSLFLTNLQRRQQERAAQQQPFPDIVTHIEQAWVRPRLIELQQEIQDGHRQPGICFNAKGQATGDRQ